MDLADAVELAVGELCTNAVRHGGGLAGLELILGAGRQFAPPALRVMVIDHAPDQAPELAGDDDPFSERGRGLHLVAALSRRWGWHRTGFDEKQVWCTFALGVPKGQRVNARAAADSSPRCTPSTPTPSPRTPTGGAKWLRPRLFLCAGHGESSQVAEPAG